MKFTRLVSSLLALWLALPSLGAAATLSAGYEAMTWAQGFPGQTTADGFTGAFGLAQAANGDLFVSDPTDNGLYRFSSPGGVAGPGTRVGTVDGVPTGLVFKNNRLYAARLSAGDVVELDPATGAVLRVLAPYLNCPSGLALDPQSGDLFVSSHCGGNVVRIQAPESAAPSAVVFVKDLVTQDEFGDSIHSPPIPGADGLAFLPDGTLFVGGLNGLYMVYGVNPPGNPQLEGVSGRVYNVGAIYGLALAPSPAGAPYYLYGSLDDGRVVRFDLSTQPPQSAPVASGLPRPAHF